MQARWFCSVYETTNSQATPKSKRQKIAIPKRCDITSCKNESGFIIQPAASEAIAIPRRDLYLYYTCIVLIL